jgi:hypothetical protein
MFIQFVLRKILDVVALVGHITVTSFADLEYESSFAEISLLSPIGGYRCHSDKMEKFEVIVTVGT